MASSAECRAISANPRESRFRELFVKSFTRIWLVALAVKTIIAIWLPLSNDEAYYWVWGHHPQLSYFDHPPMVGWLFWLGTFLEGFGNAARLPGVWLAHSTLLVWNRILGPVLDERGETLWLILVLFSSFMGVGSLIITPDVPLLFFWSLSMFLLLRAVASTSLFAYAALGASLGLGFCSKYLIVLFVPIALLWLLWSGQWRRVRWSCVPVTIAVGLLFCAPVIHWNWKHEWASFAFQLGHGLASEERNPQWPLQYLAGQIALLFPPLIWLAIRGREPKEMRFLHFFGWLPLAFFLFTSFKARVEANWPVMAHPSILALAYLNMRDMRVLKVTVGVWIAALAVIFSQVIHPWIPLDPRRLKTNEFTKFDVFLPEAEKRPDLFLGSYQMAAAVSYKLRRQVYKLDGMNRRDFYDFIPHSKPKGDRFAVGAEIGHPLPAWVQEKGFEVTETRRLSDEFQILEVQKRAQNPDR